MQVPLLLPGADAAGASSSIEAPQPPLQQAVPGGSCAVNARIIKHHLQNFGAALAALQHLLDFPGGSVMAAANAAMQAEIIKASPLSAASPALNEAMANYFMRLFIELNNCPVELLGVTHIGVAQPAAAAPLPAAVPAPALTPAQLAALEFPPPVQQAGGSDQIPTSIAGASGLNFSQSGSEQHCQTLPPPPLGPPINGWPRSMAASGTGAVMRQPGGPGVSAVTPFLPAPERGPLPPPPPLEQQQQRQHNAQAQPLQPSTTADGVLPAPHGGGGPAAEAAGQLQHFAQPAMAVHITAEEQQQPALPPHSQPAHGSSSRAVENRPHSPARNLAEERPLSRAGDDSATGVAASPSRHAPTLQREDSARSVANAGSGAGAAPRSVAPALKYESSGRGDSSREFSRRDDGKRESSRREDSGRDLGRRDTIRRDDTGREASRRDDSRREDSARDASRRNDSGRDSRPRDSTGCEGSEGPPGKRRPAPIQWQDPPAPPADTTLRMSAKAAALAAAVPAALPVPFKPDKLKKEPKAPSSSSSAPPRPSRTAGDVLRALYASPALLATLRALFDIGALTAEHVRVEYLRNSIEAPGGADAIGRAADWLAALPLAERPPPEKAFWELLSKAKEFRQPAAPQAQQAHPQQRSGAGGSKSALADAGRGRGGGGRGGGHASGYDLYPAGPADYLEPVYGPTIPAYITDWVGPRVPHHVRGRLIAMYDTGVLSGTDISPECLRELEQQPPGLSMQALQEVDEAVRAGHTFNPSEFIINYCCSGGML